MGKKTVLFVCIANSARSLMAEAILKDLAGDQFDVFSAGTQPKSVDLKALETIQSFGLETTGLSAKSVDEFKDISFDFVITLCEKDSLECVVHTEAKTYYSWDFPDPKTRESTNPYVATFNEISGRIKLFVSVETK